ncbi:hypothetical protein J6590_076373 [Homalodisca vitripennis]|nr:hypothetical protein J6590_076373 [Homalodisca vitripennis]
MYPTLIRVRRSFSYKSQWTGTADNDLRASAFQQFLQRREKDETTARRSRHYGLQEQWTNNDLRASAFQQILQRREKDETHRQAQVDNRLTTQQTLWSTGTADNDLRASTFQQFLQRREKDGGVVVGVFGVCGGVICVHLPSSSFCRDVRRTRPTARRRLVDPLKAAYSPVPWPHTTA